MVLLILLVLYRNFSAAFVLCIGFEGQTINRKRHAANLQNSNQNSILFWFSLIGLQELCFYGDLNLYIIHLLDCWDSKEVKHVGNQDNLMIHMVKLDSL